VKSFIEIFKQLCASNDLELQFRVLYIIRNIVRANKQIATRIVETDLMDILFAIKEMKDDRLVNEKVRRKIFLMFIQLDFFSSLESKSSFRYCSNLLGLWTYSTE
jgi:hypothetical protein